MTGWGFTDRPAVTVGNAVGRGLIGGTGGKAAVLDALEAGTFIRSPHGTGDDYAAATRITIKEAAALQTYPDRIHRGAPTGLVALDLFAGTGWGVACAELGIEEHGVELMPEAVATRAANGMRTLYRDVWEGLEHGERVPPHSVLIASPPCQTFSMAGSGAGRRALDEVLALIDAGAYRDVAHLRAFGAAHDMRTALVLTPLAHVYRDAPLYVVLEQVPQVLPVWERMAEVMRRWGYSVVTGVLNAEQYGVPQTRRRAILIARADGVEARMPTPTHSRYYSRDPKRLDDGVLPWVSMAEALGWPEGAGTIERHGGAGMLERHGERAGRPTDDPALTVTGSASGTTPGGFAVMRSNYGTSSDPANRGERGEDQPAPTMTSKAGRNQWTRERPSPTVVATRRSSEGMLVGRQLADDTRRDVGGHAGGVGLKPGQLPGERVTAAEAAALQTYPPEFDWTTGIDGKPLTKTKAFLQIGNAVPPRLARAVLETLFDRKA